MSFNQFLLILVSVLLNTTANLFIRKGASEFSFENLSIEKIIILFTHVTLNPFIIAGISSFVLSLVLWIIVVSKLEASYAVPFMSLSYIFLAFFSWLFLHENISPLRLLGIVVIILGVFILSKS